LDSNTGILSLDPNLALMKLSFDFCPHTCENYSSETTLIILSIACVWRRYSLILNRLLNLSSFKSETLIAVKGRSVIKTDCQFIKSV